MAWITSLLIIVPQFFSTNGFFLEGFLVSCTFDYFSRDLKSRMLLFYMVIFGFMIPIVVIIVSYVKLYSLVKTKKSSENQLHKNYILCSNLNNLRDAVDNNEKAVCAKKSYRIYKEHVKNRKNDPETNINKNLIEKYERFRHRRGALKTDSIVIYKPSKHFLLEREIKVAKVILIKVVFFCAAWTPYVIVILLTQFVSNVEISSTSNVSSYITPMTTSIPSLLAKSSIIFNALIYTLTQKECSSYYYNLFRTKTSSYDRTFSQLVRKNSNLKTENFNDSLENKTVQI
jgi:hypothetical protein